MMVFTRITTLAVTLLLVTALLLVATAAVLGAAIPGGNQIAFVAPSNSFNWDIFVMDVDRRLAYNLTAPYFPWYVRNRQPTWSPDGRWLAFVAGNNRHMNIMVLDMFTGRMRYLSESHNDQDEPTWSPTGTDRLAYSVHNGTDWDIYVQRLDASRVWLTSSSSGNPLVGSQRNERRPVWSPDGTQITYITRNDLFVVNANGHGGYQLTFGMNVSPEDIVWSPDGTHIAFVTERSLNRDIYIAHVPTGALTNLTRERGKDHEPMWSPDGRRLAFTSNRDGDDEIYVMDRTGENLHQVTRNRYHDHTPIWSPDGRWLVYVSLAEAGGELYIISSDGGKPRRLTHNLVNEWSPTWRP